MSESGAGINESMSIRQEKARREKCDNIEEAYSKSSDSTTDNLTSALEQAPRRPRKRKLSTAVKRSQSKVKRLRPDYRDKYRNLYNEEIEIITQGAAIDEDALKTSQYGLSVWTASEKAAFFRSLDRRGRHDLRSIASDIGSKSEPEISQYIKLLQRSLAEKCSRICAPDLLQSPLEAAFELNPECTEALDRCADALSALQQHDEETNEIAKHGDMWLLTPSIGRWAEECMKEEDKRAELISSLPAAELLRLKSFLDLSKSFFMNSSDIQYNWRSHTERVQAPTIRNTAFTDLHTLAISLTRKIIKSAIFVALYRIRAANSSLKEVKKRDVSTALDILGITSTVEGYWTGLARRCNLRVFNEVRRSQPPQKEYSYKEVEDILTLKRADYVAESRSRGHSEPEDRGFRETGTDRVGGSRSSSQGISASQSTSSRSSSSLSTPEPYLGKKATTSDSSIDMSDSELLQIQKDSELNDFDLKESAQEELRLYNLLDIHFPKKAKVFNNLDKDTKDAKMAGQPLRIFREPEKQDDWTSWTEYRAEWDNPAGLVPQWKFGEDDKEREGRRGSQVLTDKELNDTDDELGNRIRESSLTTASAEVESDADSPKGGGQSRFAFKYRERLSSEEHDSSDATETESESMSPTSRSQFDVPREYSIQGAGEEEEDDDDNDDDGNSAEEEPDDML